MFVYRIYYAWYDTFYHIGIFYNQIEAWVVLYKRYIKELVYEFCFKCDILNCGCKLHRLRSRRYMRYHIKKEKII